MLEVRNILEYSLPEKEIKIALSNYINDVYAIMIDPSKIELGCLYDSINDNPFDFYCHAKVDETVKIDEDGKVQEET